MESSLFPVSISTCGSKQPGIAFPYHWHEHLEFLFITRGEGIITCNSDKYAVGKGDLVVVNSSEIHGGYSHHGSFTYYCVIVEPSILQGYSTGICEVKYLSPITRNQILFENIIRNDKAVLQCFENMIDEYERKDPGYELSIKSYIFQALSLLIRRHVKVTLTPAMYDKRREALSRLSPVLTYIAENCTGKITVAQLAKLVNLSIFHFSRLFKDLTDRTVIAYVNNIRIHKAVELLTKTEMSITDIALEAGFNNINYFSRLFKRHMKLSPQAFRRAAQGRDVS